MGEFAEQTTDIEVSLADVAGLALASGLVVTGTDADPGCQTIGTAESIHVGADLDQQHGRPDEINAGNRLQQGQGVALGFKLRQQPCIKTGDACFDFLDMTHQFVDKPDFYDVIMAENMFGDIISDLGAGTMGGPGVASSAERGERHGLFQGAYGSAPDIAGQDAASPVATMLSAALILRWLGDRHAGGSARCSEFTQAVLRQLR